MPTFADSTGLSAFPSANADRPCAAPEGRHVAAMRVPKPLRHRQRRGRPAPGDGRVGNDGSGMHDRVLHMAGRRARQWKGAPASPAPPLLHCAKYGLERVPSQEYFSLLDHFFSVPVFHPPLPRHARTCSGHPRLAASRCEPGTDEAAGGGDARNESGHDGGGKRWGRAAEEPAPRPTSKLSPRP